MKLALLASAALLAPTLAFADMTAKPALAPVTTGATHAEIMKNLRDAGYSDLKVMQEATLLQAKDQSGDPVTLVIDRGTAVKLSALGAATKLEGRSAIPGATFLNVPAGGELTSRVVGTDIYNKANENIGEIKDIVFGKNGLQAFIVGVGGFLGMGERYVAIEPSAVNLSYDADHKTWKGMMDTNKEALKSAPEFKYPDRG